MKKFLPFVFPLIALAIVGFLGYSWYTKNVAGNNGKEGQISEFGEGVQIDELSQEELNKLNTTTSTSSSAVAQDTKSVELKGTGEAVGQVRYEMKDNRIHFSVFAELPEATDGVYQVWLKEVGSDKKKKAFVLTNSKSGYTGSAAISTEALPLPFEIVVSKETKPGDEEMETSILNGVIEKQ